MSHFAVTDHHGTPTLFQDGRPTFTAIYLTVRNAQHLDQGWQPDPHFEQFRDAGFHFYSIPMPTRFDDAWDPATNEFRRQAFAPLRGLKRYAALDPQAKFLLRVEAEPRGDESAWIRAHPGECEVMEPRAKGIYKTPSFASQVWLQDGARFIHTDRKSVV